MKKALSALYRGWMKFAHALGVVQTFILLSVVYFIVVGVTAPLVRLFSGDPLRPHAETNTDWTAKGRTNRTLEEARRLF